MQVEHAHTKLPKTKKLRDTQMNDYPVFVTKIHLYFILFETLPFCDNHKQL